MTTYAEIREDAERDCHVVVNGKLVLLSSYANRKARREWIAGIVYLAFLALSFYAVLFMEM